MSAPNFDYVSRNNLCLGCGACALGELSTKIEIRISPDGYLRPVVNGELTSAEDQRFARICPGLEVKHSSKDGNWTELWGPVAGTYVGWSTDAEVRHSASSGGGITSALCYLLDRKLVDAVLHIGVSPEDPLVNTWVISSTSDEARQRCGSRYAPAAPLLGLRETLSKYRRIALVGKPCDIVAARKLANEYSDIRDGIHFYISFMCAGVPSYKGTDAVLRKMGATKDDVVFFRYRGNGWPGYATATEKSGRSFQMTYQESWGRTLNKHLQLRCKICVDGTGEFADITFADAWHGGDSGYPLFEEQAGRSLIVVRTATGSELLEGAVEHGYIERHSISATEIERMQPYQAIRKRLLLSRIIAMRMFGLAPPRYDANNMFKVSVAAGVKANVVSFLGMARRTIALLRENRKARHPPVDLKP